MSDPALGWCAPEIAEELPGLRLMSADLALDRSPRGASPATVIERLRELSNRWAGPRAVILRQKPIPAAYRVFFRHIGLDPDVTRTPVEAVVLERMLNGGFLATDLLEDVLLIALVDTGVPVWALDADTLDGPLGLRLSREGEPLGSSPDAPRLPAGRIVIADASNVLNVLFGELAPGHQVRATTRAITLFSVPVAGVPGLHAEEALWICLQALESKPQLE